MRLGGFKRNPVKRMVEFEVGLGGDFLFRQCRSIVLGLPRFGIRFRGEGGEVDIENETRCL